MHDVLVFTLSGTVIIVTFLSFFITFEIVGDLDIQVSWVLLVWSVVQGELDGFALLDIKNIFQVENGLLPVGVIGLWTCGEVNFVLLFAGWEPDIEPGDKTVDQVVSLGFQFEFFEEG
ncbi:hypothetical protein WICPIJ_002579 [Wickerhamomyces pijperi]|uniref:Uncharacterized protein n=1 Tax=Wickerhamomyces pijperi TaxID=599730 RepID=A0A9P8QB47_WICPI|nr:hypothetical protein WICPIJ_002579 [Wickerhamomyces pijperi]